MRIRSQGMQPVGTGATASVASADDSAGPPTKGVPVRDMLQAVYTVGRDLTVKEFLVYAVYFAIFVAVVYQINDSVAINSVSFVDMSRDGTR